MLQTPQPSLQRFVDRLTSRSVLSDEEKEVIMGLPSRTQKLAANQDFVRLGERVDHACFIVNGLVGRFEQTSKGARQITALYIAGDMPDLMSVVQPTAGLALQTLSPATILRVPHSALRQAATDHPAIAEAFWRDCMVDAMILAQWVVNVGRRNALTRISHLLCEMACRSGVVGGSDEVTFTLPMTQSHLADATSLTPVHVNRTLKALLHNGVRFRGKTVRIADWDGLRMLGDFNSRYLQVDGSPPERVREPEPAR